MRLLVRDKRFYKSYFYLTFSIALQNVITFGVALADNMMLGGYDEIALSGAALVNQVQYLLQMVVVGVGGGLVVMASRYWGKNEVEPIRKISSIAMRITLLFALALWAVMFFFPTQSLSLLANEAPVIKEGVRYLRIVCFSYFFFAVTNTLLFTLRSVETVRIAFLVSLSTLIINICLNYVLIYGHFGVPALGSQGAAIATLTSRIVETLITVYYVAKRDTKIRLKWADFRSLDRPLFRDFMRTGLPIIIANFSWGIAMGLNTAILGRMGQSAISASSIAMSIFQIFAVVAYGSANGTAVLMAKTIGEGKTLDEIKAYTVTLQMIYVLIGVVTGIALFLGKDFILSFYKISAETYALCRQFLLILSFTVVGTAYQVAAAVGIVAGGGDTKFTFINDTIFMWFIGLPAAALCAFVWKLSPAVVFLCLKSDQVLKCITGFIKVNRYRWIKNIGDDAR